MASNNLTTFVAGMIVAASAAIFAATIAEPVAGVADFGSWVDKNQTLITGAFALLAAYLTIAQMRASDDENERRHRQLFGMALRSDFLRIHRAFMGFPRWREEVKSITCPRPDPEKPITDQIALSFAKDVWKAVKAIRDYNENFLVDDDIKQVLDLFDGHMLDARRRVQAAAARIYHMAQKLGVDDYKYDPKDGRYMEPEAVFTRAEVGVELARLDQWEQAFGELQGALEEYHARVQAMLDAYSWGDVIHGAPSRPR
ncbi:hypothetical protein ABIA22_000371 [Sinorhizobium fredii]|uniref:hypothetical protein n=1 Tax=Rhizobium fredii TaxID=380 RepID=UPI0035147818